MKTTKFLIFTIIFCLSMSLYALFFANESKSAYAEILANLQKPGGRNNAKEYQEIGSARFKQVLLPEKFNPFFCDCTIYHRYPFIAEKNMQTLKGRVIFIVSFRLFTNYPDRNPSLFHIIF